MTRQSMRLFDSALMGPAIADSFRKLSPRVQLRNPVMFVVYVGSILTTVLWVQALRGQGEAPTGFIFAIAAWLWFTVLFANFAEALAEGRSKAQAASLRGLKQSVSAKKLAGPTHDAKWETVQATALRKGDYFLVELGNVIPADGVVVEGVATAPALLQRAPVAYAEPEPAPAPIIRAYLQPPVTYVPAQPPAYASTYGAPAYGPAITGPYGPPPAGTPVVVMREGVPYRTVMR